MNEQDHQTHPLGQSQAPIRRKDAALPVLQNQTGPQKQARSPAQQAAEISKTTAGTPTNSISPTLINTLEYTPHLNTVLSTIGRGLTANLMMGSTRALATPKAGKGNNLSDYARPVIPARAALDLKLQLKNAQQNGTLPATLQAFQAANGKSLATVIGERVQDTGVRSALLKLLPNPISARQLTRDAFLENIAVSFAYSNQSAADMNSKSTTDERRGGSSGQVLAAFGYKAGDSLDGAWGMQMRVFTPVVKKGQKVQDQPIIIAFRGTEGLTPNAYDGTEGGVDTIAGDATRSEPGVVQMRANRAWMDRVIKAAVAKGQKITFVGHSLGGALAQEAAARYAQHTAGVVTFQAANIPQQDADRVAAYNKAHPGKAIVARQYRVEGDSVPTAGTTAIAGDINYFDRVSRAVGSSDDMKVAPVSNMTANMEGGFNAAGVGKAAANLVASGIPFMSLEAASSGHTTPMLSTYLRSGASQGLDGQADDPQRQALMKYGLHDEQTSAHIRRYTLGDELKGPDGKPLLDAKGKPKTATFGQPMLGPDGKPLMTEVKDVGAVFAGSYAAGHDPRLNAEAQRKHVLPQAVSLANGGAAANVFEHNIAFNTAIQHMFELAGDKKYTTLAEFSAAATVLLTAKDGKVVLSMVKEDVDLAMQFSLDKSPRANAEFALKDFTGLNKNNVEEEAAKLWKQRVGTPLGSAWGAKKAKAYFNDFVNGFKNTPTLEQYRVNEKGEHEVVIDPEAVKRFDKDRYLAIWRLFHPGDSK